MSRRKRSKKNRNVNTPPRDDRANPPVRFGRIRFIVAWTTVVTLVSLLFVSYFVPRWTSATGTGSDGLSFSLAPASRDTWQDDAYGVQLSIYVSEERSWSQTLGLSPRVLTVGIFGMFQHEILDTDPPDEWVLKSNLEVLETSDFFTSGPAKITEVGQGLTTEPGPWKPAQDGKAIVSVAEASVDTNGVDPEVETVFVNSRFRVLAPSIERGVDPDTGDPVEHWLVNWEPADDDPFTWSNAGFAEVAGSGVLQSVSSRPEGNAHDGRVNIVLGSSPLTIYNQGEKTGLGEYSWTGPADQFIPAGFTMPWTPWQGLHDFSVIAAGLLIATVVALVIEKNHASLRWPGKSGSSSTKR